MNAKWTPALALAVCGVLSLACGGGGGGGGGDSSDGKCQFEVKGGPTSGATYPCSDGSPLVRQLGDVTNVVVFGQKRDGQTPSDGITVAINVAGAPKNGTYTLTSAASETQGWSIDVFHAAGTTQVWLGGGGPNAAVSGGNCTLTITSVGAIQADNSYAVHGSMHATVPADVSTGASGEVTLDLTF